MRIFLGNKHFLFGVIIALLALVFFLASTLVYLQQRDQQHQDLLEKANTEAELIGAILTDFMLRNDYFEGLQFLREWPENHPEVELLEVEFDNGQKFFSFRAPTYTKTEIISKRAFQYGMRHLTIRLALNSDGVSRTLASLVDSLILLSLFLTGLIGSALWYMLFQWMIKPLEIEISARRKSEEQLRKLSRAVDQSSNMIFITDRDGLIEYVNPKFTELSGYTPDEALGKTPRLLKSDETPDEVYRDLWATILTGNNWRGELKDRRKDGGDFWAAVSISPVKSEDGCVTHFVAMHEDITHRKKTEQKVRKAMGQAQSANKAKSELLANMSHELRTPLNAIIGFSDTIKSEIFGPIGNSRYADYTSHIFDSAEHLLQLINDILDVSAIEAGKVELHEENLSIYEIVENCFRLIEPRANEGNVSVVKALPDGLPPFVGDERRIKQSLINLLSNAVKFTPEGGSVTLAAELSLDGGLELSVMDTGVGMGKKQKEKAMTQFGQVDSGLNRKHEGTGLGLPLVKGLVELHGGRFVLDSKPGKGTTARILLPPSRVLKQMKSVNIEPA